MSAPRWLRICAFQTFTWPPTDQPTNYLFFRCAKAPLKLAVSVGRSVCLLVTHSSDDPHGAPHWPTWPCFHFLFFVTDFKIPQYSTYLGLKIFLMISVQNTAKMSFFFSHSQKERLQTFRLKIWICICLYLVSINPCILFSSLWYLFINSLAISVTDIWYSID